MQIVLLVIALSVDVFVASMACGAEYIVIEKKTALCISGICSGVLFLSLVAGNLLQGVMREEYAKWFCFFGLLAVGVFKLVEYGIKVYVQKHQFFCKRIKITISQIQFILSIYNNPVEADKDHSASMSVSEGIFFALAMSLDGFLGGLGASFLEINIWEASVLNFLLSFLVVIVGCRMGKHMAQHSRYDLSWVGGALFVGLAFSKII